LTSIVIPPPLSKSRLRFWLSYVAGFFGFGYVLLWGGLALRDNYTLQMIGLLLAVCVSLSWLIWRWMIWRDHLPRTGLEWPMLVGLATVFISLAFSPDMRQGFSRSGWLLAYALFFFFFLNILDSSMDRWGLLGAAFTISGLILFQAVNDTVQWYRDWFAAAGGFSLPPVQYRFTGLLGNSNITMAMANLFVPVVLLAIRRFRNPLARVLCGLWILIYIAAVPFSSSRGGWLGLVVALGLGIIYWAWKARWIARIRRWPRRQLTLLISGLLILVLLAGFLGIKFLVTFATNPSHGGDPFGGSGREVFWANAIKIWQASPLVGAGPGRFAFAYLQYAPSIPPGYWPGHAHDIFLEALAEFGLAGLAALLFLLAGISVWAWRRLMRASPQAQSWTAAILAGESGLLIQMVFDDLTFFMAVMIPAIFLLAWMGSNGDSSLPTYRRISLGWLILPVCLVVAVAGWSIWTHQPFNQASADAQVGDWANAAEQATISVNRDPNSYNYTSGAGLLWACQAYTAKDIPALIRARGYLEQALRLEPTTSWNWADLAMLDEAFGELDTAIDHMERAVKLSPNLPSYWYNLGRFYEKTNLPEMAISSYQKALDLKPDWRDLAFWSETPAREQALTLWLRDPPVTGPPENTFWRQAQTAIQAGNLDEAGRLLVMARLMAEPEIDIIRTELLLAEARPDSVAIQPLRDHLQELVDQSQNLLDGLMTFPCPSFQGSGGEYGNIVVPGLGTNASMLLGQ
jgi:putative inorganic carbon (HCO3(-)) transporter